MDKQEVKKKDVAKAYEKYSKQFTPKPTYFSNCLKAFIVGGLVCTVAYYVSNFLVGKGLPEKDAIIYVTIGIVALAAAFDWIWSLRQYCPICGSWRYRSNQRFCKLYGCSGNRI